MREERDEGYIAPSVRIRNAARNPSNRWLHNIMNSTKLESEFGECPVCRRKEIEFKVWRLGDGTIKKYKECPDCLAKYEEEKAAEEKSQREIEVNNTRQDSIKSSGIPPKFLTEGFSSFNKGWQDKALKFCKKYADDFPIDKRPEEYPSLYLWSAKSWGVGKTHLSCAIAHRIFTRWTGEGRSCPRIYFISEPDLFRQIQATYSFNREDQQARESEDDIMRRLTFCDLLILDDVGKETRAKPDFVRKILFTIKNCRWF